MLEVIDLHRCAVAEIPDAKEFSYLKDEAAKVWERAAQSGKRYGYRNAQVTVLAPTGTISFLMDCDTTGIEPDIALVKYKLLAGGGMLKIVNQTVKPALEKLGYNSEEIERIIAHIDAFDTIEDVPDTDGSTISSGLKPEHLPIFDCAFEPCKGERSLGYMGHLRMMAAAQPFLSGAISKTVNMPKGVTVEEIMDAYVEGWRLGLKSIAMYRDGSKRSAPLNTRKTKDMGGDGDLALDVTAEPEDLQKRILELEEELAMLRGKVDQPVRHRMPDTRMSLTHRFEIAGHEGYITIGLYEDNQPGELFITMSKEGSTIGGLMDTVGTLTSIALQYGVPLESLVKNSLTSVSSRAGSPRIPISATRPALPITFSVIWPASSSKATRKRRRRRADKRNYRCAKFPRWKRRRSIVRSPISRARGKGIDRCHHESRA